MSIRFPRVLSSLVCCLALASPVWGLSQELIPTPAEAVGVAIGEDYQLADYSRMLDYFRMLDERSDRFHVSEYGRSAEGRPMILAIVTSPENYRSLERYREISRRLALNQVASDEEARRLAGEGKAVVWLDAGLHATEIAHAQHSFLLAHQLATRDDEEIRRILDDVILLFAPCINPDGMDQVTHWYREHQNLGIPELYQKYVGHDNNRDFIMLSQPETQAMAKVMYRDWIPQIVYNHHQQAPRGTAIFVPEFRGPFNYNIDPMIMRGINLVSAAMKMRFEEEGKAGVISRETYSTWWNGGLRTAAYFHNQIGILTETGIADPAPRRILPSQERLEPLTDYPNPLRERTWHLRDSIDYMLTGSWAVLDVASRYRQQMLYNIYLTGRRAVERGRSEAPYGFLIPSGQEDPGTVRRLVNTLIRSGLEVRRLDQDIELSGRRYAAGSYLLDAAQPFRAHLMDLLTPQRHPDRLQYPGGPPDPPYDIAGWTLSYSMGVEADPLSTPLPEGLRTSRLEDELAVPEGRVEKGPAYAYWLSPSANDAYAAVSSLLQEGKQVYRARKAFRLGRAPRAAGTFLIIAADGVDDRLSELARERGVSFGRVESKPPDLDVVQLKAPRLGLYDVFGGNMDEGWTRFILEGFDFPYQKLWGSRIAQGGLQEAFDVILIPDGIRIGTEGSGGGRRRGGGPLPEGYEERAPMGKEGVEKLREFVEEGGILVTLGGSAMMAIEELKLPVENVLMRRDAQGNYRSLSREDFYCPGSVLEAEFEPGHPLAYGMSEVADVFFRNSPTFSIREGESERVSVAASYPDRNPLRSGWIHGEQRIYGQSAIVEATLGKGRVLLLGPRVQFRSQSHGTYKVLFNAILYGGASPTQLP